MREPGRGRWIRLGQPAAPRSRCPALHQPEHSFIKSCRVTFTLHAGLPASKPARRVLAAGARRTQAWPLPGSEAQEPQSWPGPHPHAWSTVGLSEAQGSGPSR